MSVLGLLRGFHALIEAGFKPNVWSALVGADASFRDSHRLIQDSEYFAEKFQKRLPSPLIQRRLRAPSKEDWEAKEQVINEEVELIRRGGELSAKTVMALGKIATVWQAAKPKTSIFSEGEYVIGFDGSGLPKSARLDSPSLVTGEVRYGHYAPFALLFDLDLQLAPLDDHGRIQLEWRNVQMFINFLNYLEGEEGLHFRLPDWNEIALVTGLTQLISLNFEIKSSGVPPDQWINRFWLKPGGCANSFRSEYPFQIGAKPLNQPDQVRKCLREGAVLFATHFQKDDRKRRGEKEPPPLEMTVIDRTDQDTGFGPTPTPRLIMPNPKEGPSSLMAIPKGSSIRFRLAATLAPK